MELDRARVLDAGTWQQRRKHLDELGGPPSELARLSDAADQDRQ
jgi:hypothetical protein